ncbi:MAG TPA: serine/threonine-protein kinase [Planctomycetota bacterium]|nr:serine/threonine-protein kinase [Planctomycetota bacterium]
MTAGKGENLTGRTIEKCKLVAKLGTGGMGSVYLAEHAGLNRKVAVKILPADMSRDPEYVARFKREALTAARMEHPNIVQIHDVGQADGRWFIVQQYVDGESLATIVDNLGAMDPRDAARVTAGILRGLQHAHEQGVVHRDVKPDNVLVTKGDQPKLLDFGLAIEQEASLQITKDGMVVGTPYYLSPEQARGQKATPMSDIYAAGVTLYYLLTGKRPFTGATALAVLNKHIHEAPVPPSTANPKVPSVLSDIVLKLMAKRPQDRYPSAGAAATALENFLAGKAVDARLPWRARLEAVPVRTRKIAAAAAGALGVLIVAGLVAALAGGSKPPPPPPPPAPERTADAPPAKDPALVDLKADATRALGDFSEWDRILARFDAYIELSTQQPAQAAQAQESRDEFVHKIRERAKEEFAKARRGASDPVDQLRAIESLPRAIVTVDELREFRRHVRDAREQLLEQLDFRFLEDEAKLDKLLVTGDFAGARRHLDQMKRYVPQLRYAAEARSKRLALAETETLPRLERDAADRLVQAYVAVRQAFDLAMAERSTAKAYAAPVEFLRKTADPRVRASGVNYDLLMGIVPDDQLSPARLGTATLALGTVWGRATDDLAFRILADLQDALDMQWLIRQAALGLARLSRAGSEAALQSGTGRVTLGPKGYQLQPKAGSPKILEIVRLPATDLALLAAAAEQQTLEQALELNAQLARAYGVAWQHSTAPQRFLEAETLYAAADGRGAPGPAFRRTDLREQARRNARAEMARARSSAGFEEAIRSLTALLPSFERDPDMKLEIVRSAAAVLIAEIRREKNHGRIKTLARQLFNLHEPSYQEAALVDAFGRAAESTKTPRALASDLKSGVWTWERAEAKAPPPAVDESAQALGLKLKPGARLDVAPSLRAGATGLFASMRYNERKAYEMGLFFDAVPAEGRMRKLVARSPGELALVEVHNGRETVLHVHAGLPLKAGAWIELGFVLDGETFVAFVEKAPVFALRLPTAPGGPDRPLGLTSTVSANARMISLRKG